MKKGMTWTDTNIPIKMENIADEIKVKEDTIKIMVYKMRMVDAERNTKPTTRGSQKKVNPRMETLVSNHLSKPISIALFRYSIIITSI